LLTGSPTFPFLLKVFPSRNLNIDEWVIVEAQVKAGLRYEFFNLGLKNWIFLFASICISTYIITRNFLSRFEKALFLLFLIPTLLTYWLGFRHRIILFSCFIFIFIDVLERKKASLVTEVKEIFNYLKLRAPYLFFILIFLLSIKNIVNNYSEQVGNKISIKSVKKCFYGSISELSVSNKILLTETELMRIANTKNIEPVDGKNFSEMLTLKSADEFVKYLKYKKIKYVTHTPLSSQELEFSESNAFNRFMPELLKTGDLVVYKDCVAENYINNKIWPFNENKILRNWLIYEVR
jgi:hypothetical protein